MSVVAGDVLVTGGTGNVGAPLVRRLVERGVRVRVAVRDPGPAPIASDMVERVRFEFGDPRSYASALAGVERLFLLRPPAISDVEAQIHPFVTAAVAAGVRQIVFLSVVGADRARFIPHAKIEAHLRASGVETWTFLRAGFFAQNLVDTYAPDIRGEDRLYLPAGDGKVAFVDAEDLAEVAALALTSPLDDPRFARRAPSLTGPVALDFDAVASLLSAELGRPIRYERASAFGAYRHLRRRGLVRAQALVVCALHIGLRFGQAETVDPTLAQLLDRAPRELGEFIRGHRSSFER